MAKSTIEQQIEQDAQSAQSVTVDGTSTSEHSLRDKIEADRYLRATGGLSRPGAGVVFQKIVPHGSVR